MGNSFYFSRLLKQIQEDVAQKNLLHVTKILKHAKKRRGPLYGDELFSGPFGQRLGLFQNERSDEVKWCFQFFFCCFGGVSSRVFYDFLGFSRIVLKIF